MSRRKGKQAAATAPPVKAAPVAAAGQGTGLSVQARYDAAGNGRRMKAWHPPTSGPNRAITGLQKIRDRSRDATRNDWSGEAPVTKWTTTLVGTGIVPRFKRIKNKARKQVITDLWNDFARLADADGVLNFSAMQALAVRSWLDSGEVFLRVRWRDPTLEFLPVPMQLQLIEADQVPLLDADIYTGLPVGNTIRSGIERNKYGRRTAYWMYREHPSDAPASGSRIDPSRLIRVPADQVRHIYELKRVGQLRGVSMLAPVLARLRNIENYDDAVLTRQQIANLFTLFITRAIGAPDGEDDIDPLTNAPFKLDSDGTPLATLMPGTSQELDPGQDVKFSNPPEAGTTYSDYMRTMHMGTAAGAGMPYELFSGDIKEVSDRTLRVLVNEYRRFAEQRQWHTVIPGICEPTAQWFAEAGVISGLIRVEEFDDVRRAEWAPHGWAYIHPVQDVQGKKVEVEAGFRSRSSVVGERGDDPESVDDERASDMQREKDLDLYVAPASAAKPGKKGEADNDGIDSTEYTKPPSALMEAHLDRVRAEARMYDAQAFRARGEQQPQPTPEMQPIVNVHAHIPQPVVNVTVEPTPVVIENKVEAPNVTVENRVEPTPVVIENRVEAPNVTVNNAVDVPPAEVTVNLPDRRTETTVTRNKDGQITKTVQIETDADASK